MATYNTEQEPNQNSIPGVEGDSNSQERNIEELHGIIEDINEERERMGAEMPEPPESLQISTPDCGGNCAIAFIVDVTQCEINCPANILDAHIHIQSSPTATPIILADINGNPITAANVIPNNTGYSVAVFTAIAKFENKLFVIIKYYTPGQTSGQNYKFKLVKLHLHVNCTASVIWTKDNFADSRALCAVDEDTLILSQGSNVLKIDLTAVIPNPNPALPPYQYNVTTLFNISYGIGGQQTNTQYLTVTIYDMIEDLVYVPSSDIIAVLVNGGNTGLYTPEILTYQISDWNNAWGCGGGGGAGPCNLQVGTSGAFPLGGTNYQASHGNLSLYCYNGNIFTHNSEGNIWEWEMDAQGDISMIQGANHIVGWGSHLPNVFYGHGDAASSPACCDGALEKPPCPEIGDIGPGGGLVFAVPYTGWNNTKYYYEVALQDCDLRDGLPATGGTPINSASFSGCNPNGQAVSGAEWGAYGKTNISTLIDFGWGQKNTDVINSYGPIGPGTPCVACHPVLDTHDIAAYITRNPAINSTWQGTTNYSGTPEDWFLPSLFEFWYMYMTVGPGTPFGSILNLSQATFNTLNNQWNGDGMYWTSSQYAPYNQYNPGSLTPSGTFPATFPGEENFAWAFQTNPTAQGAGAQPYLSRRCSTWSVRAVRRFECEVPRVVDPPPVTDPSIQYDYRIQGHNNPGGISFYSHNRNPQDVPGFPMNPSSSNPPSGSPGYAGPYPNYMYPFDLAWDENKKIGGKWMFMTVNNFDIRGNQLGVGQVDMKNKINSAHLPTMPTINNSGTGIPITIKIYSQDETLIAHYEYERFWMTPSESNNTFWNGWFTGSTSEPFGDPGVYACPAGPFSGAYCSWKTRWRLYNEVYSITPGQIIDLNNYSGVNAMINDQSNTAGPIGYVTLDWVLSGTTVDLNSIIIPPGGPNFSTSTNIIGNGRGDTANLSTHFTGNKRITDIVNFPSPGISWPHTCNDCGTNNLASQRHMLEIEPTPSSWFWNNIVYNDYMDSVNGVIGGSCGGNRYPITQGGTQAKLLSSGCGDIPTIQEEKENLSNVSEIKNKKPNQNKRKYR